MNFGDIELQYQRYAIDNLSPPSFFRTGDDGKIEDIRTIIDSKNPEQMKQEIPRLVSEFNLTIDDITYLYIQNLYGDDPTLAQLTSILPSINTFKKHGFGTASMVLAHFKKYMRRMVQDIAVLKERIDSFDGIVSQLKEYNKSNYPFTIEEKTIEKKVKIVNDLQSIFDSMDLSNDLQFIHLGGENNWFKIRDNFNPPESWIHETGDNIFLKISYGHSIVWKKGGIIRFNYKEGTTIKENDLYEILDHSLGNRVQYDDIYKKDVGIKCRFDVQNISFNKAIFADLVSTNKLFQSFLFFNESSKTVLASKRYTVYYKPNHFYNPKKSLVITITPKNTEDYISVRVSRAKSINEVEEFQKVFSRLLEIYRSEKKNILGIYSSLFSSTKGTINTFEPVKSKKVVDKKSGRRLQRLKEARPYYFRSGYASQCQPKDHQPILLSEKELEDFETTAKSIYGDDINWKHLLLQFPNKDGPPDTYACIPRDEDDKNKKYIWPGLRSNTEKSGKYKEDVPNFPCCYSSDQYDKKGSLVYKQTHQVGLKKSDHIFGQNKLLPPDRLGAVPYNVKYIVEKAGYSPIKRGKQKTLPLLRYGVAKAPDSLIHCFETAFNSDYIYEDEDTRLEFVKKVRSRLSKLPNYNVGLQELYNISEAEARAIMRGDGYIDVDLWIRVLETFYKCHAYVFYIDSKDKNGSVNIPRHSKAYLLPERKYDRSIVIFKMKTANQDQYEILTDIREYGKYIFTDILFLKELISVFKNAVCVSTVTPFGDKKYRNDAFEKFDSAIAQFVDGSGKLRMLFFEDGVSLMTPPLTPEDLPLSNKITNVSIDLAIDFAKRNNIPIKYQDVDFMGDVKGIWVDLPSPGYIYTVPSKKIDLESSPIGMRDYMSVQDDSRLEKFHHARRSARLLQQYTLYEYVQQGLSIERFEKSAFRIVPDHKYIINQSSVIFDRTENYSDGKIIVQSQNIANRLIYYLKNRLFNDDSFMTEYIGDNVIIRDRYQSIFDFRKLDHGEIFNSVISLERWLEREQKGCMILSQPKIDTKEPYYYKNFQVEDGYLCILQNVEDGEKKRAIAVSKKWSRDRVNSGYWTEPEEKENGRYNIYSVLGYVSNTGADISIFRYYNGSYAALLPIHKV